MSNRKYLTAKKRASLLIFAIWVLVFFSILNVAVYKIVSSQLAVAKVLEQRQGSLWLAKAACLHAKFIRQGDSTEYDTLYELRTQHQAQLGRGKFSYSIVDEESKININTAPADILAGLPGLSEELAAIIVESDLRPFAVKEQILMVEGISRDVYDNFKDMVTVYGSGAVNINTAPGGVLSALGFDDDLIRSIKDYRSGPDFLEGTEDDVAFESIDASKVASFLRDQTLVISLKSKNLLGVSSEAISLEINTELLDRPATRYIIVMEGKKIKRWIEK